MEEAAIITKTDHFYSSKDGFVVKDAPRHDGRTSSLRVTEGYEAIFTEM